MVNTTEHLKWHRAAYWKKEHEIIQCQLCPRQCEISEQGAGFCGIRYRQDDVLWAQGYAQIAAAGLDPIEKKPFFHVMPGSKIYSIGSAGCNLKCFFCQNWTISQTIPSMNQTSPQEVVAQAIHLGACGVAYTYNEPLINIEFVLDCAQFAHEQGLLNTIVTNGYIQAEPLEDLLPYIDAWNIDIKSMRDDFYKKNCAGHLAPVLETIQKTVTRSHVELTHLMVTDENDELGQIHELIDWIASVSSEIPLHLTRYYPHYQAKKPPTDPEKLLAAKKIAEKKLSWVYLGNLRSSDDATVCPACGTTLIHRQGFVAHNRAVKNGKCQHCERFIPGIFKT